MKQTFFRAILLVAFIFTVSPHVQAAPPPSAASDNSEGPQGGPSPGGSGQGSQGGPPPHDGPREACRSDAQTFCKNIQPGGGRIKDCLEDHYKQLSDACYNALKNAPPGPPPGSGHNRGPGKSGGGQPPESNSDSNDDGDNGPPPKD